MAKHRTRKAKTGKKAKKKPPKLDKPGWFVNRELSWLEFNHRVLGEGLSPDVPLMERLKFLAIVSSNLDEFFMIRVGGLMQQRDAKLRKRDVAGLTPLKQLAAIAQRTHRMVAEQATGITDALNELATHGLAVLGPADWTVAHRRFLRKYFADEILPVLTPLAVEDLQPSPLLPGLQLNVGLLLAGGTTGKNTLVVLPVPSQLPRFVPIPRSADDSGACLARSEDVIAAHAGMLFENTDIAAGAVFRITRDADVAIADDEADDLLQAVEQAIISRRKRSAVRLEISAAPHRHIRAWLVEHLQISSQDVYEIPGLLDARALMDLASRPGFDSLRNTEWPPQPPRDLIGTEDLWQAIRDHDVLLQHPYEKFDPVVQMVEQAADDPNVLAIKQTLYRTSGDSPIISALERAANAGKQVTVLVELKARFDEARNVTWARRLEDAGCHVLYGVAGVKTHAKALLVVRREQTRLRRYLHLATGNYNDTTARMYSDIGLMTADRDLTQDAAAFFNLLTGASESTELSKLIIAPTTMRNHLVELIEREIRTTTPDRPGGITAKVNSLQDKGLCQALYRASAAGVKVRLNVRGICCLRPGIKGVSDTIEVRSIVDRYLEHARVFYFRNGGHEEVYLSSADWMTRNLDKRLETLFPVQDPTLRRRLLAMLEICFADNTKAWQATADGTYQRVATKGPRVQAQQALYQEASATARSTRRTQQRFRPLKRPQD